MPKIYAYQKHIDNITTRTLCLTQGGRHEPIGTELATIDGLTYVSLPDDATLPADQPAEISASITLVTLDAATRSAIKAASPYVRFVNQQVAAKIAAAYSVVDEIKLLRTAPSPEFEVYNAHVEDCRQWGREQKAALGL